MRRASGNETLSESPSTPVPAGDRLVSLIQSAGFPFADPWVNPRTIVAVAAVL
jgi:hypothetical protein